MNRSEMLALLGGAALAAPTAANAQTPALAPLRIGVIPAEVASQPFYATDLGTFRGLGIDPQLQFFSNGNAIAAAIAGGSIDVGLSDVVSVINAHVRGLPFVFLAPGLITTNAAPTFGLLVKADSPIHEAKDFNNTTVGVNALNTISQLPFQAWIDKNGGDLKSIKFIEIPLPQSAAAVMAGTAAATVPTEPFLTIGADSGARVILMQKNTLAPSFMVSGWVASDDWIGKNGVLAAKFAAAMKQTAAWANANHTASAAILSKYTKLAPALVDRMRRGTFSTAFNDAEVQPVIDAAVKYGIVSRSFPAAEILHRERA
jgi:NitT/TauT family transport system substrate-binding protein